MASKTLCAVSYRRTQLNTLTFPTKTTLKQRTLFVSKRYFRFSSTRKSLWPALHSADHVSNGKSFPVLDGSITKCDKFATNKKNYLEIENKFEKLSELAGQGGGEKAIKRHLKQNKMLVDDRIRSLLDKNSPFLELSVIGGMGMKYGNVPRTGLVTGIGRIQGKYCMIIANDATVKGGSVYPITLKKQLRAQEIAEQNGLPCIYIVESGGAFLPLQSEIFNPGGRTFYNEAIMSSKRIPQIAIVCGSCTAGGAYIPTMADQAIIVHKAGTIFLGGPPLVQAALGEIVTAEELGGATLHCKTSGYTDYFAENEETAFQLGRNVVESLNIYDKSCDFQCADIVEPQFDINDIPGLIPKQQSQENINIYQVIARLVDGSQFHEFKQLYGVTLKCGFSYLNGYLVGIIANQGEITTEAALKGSHFVLLCSERQIPIIFLQNTSTTESHLSEMESAERLKAHSKLISAVACSKIPKLTVRIGNGFGSAQYMMGGSCMNPNFLFSWPNSLVGIKSPKSLAAKLLQDTQLDFSGNERQKLLLDNTIKLTNDMSAVSTSAQLLDDGVIKPKDTRKILSECLRIVLSYQTYTSTDYPVFRM